MSHKYDINAEYCLVKGWFNETHGLHESKFYGACFYEDNPFIPYRVVLEGKEAHIAASKAFKSNLIINSHSLKENELKNEKTEAIEKDPDDEVIIEKDPDIVPPEFNKAPSKGAKSGNKGKDKEGVGDLKSESKQLDEMNVGGESFGRDVPIKSEFGDIAKPEPVDQKTPQEENVENLQKFYGDVTDAIAKVDGAAKIVLGFGLENEIDEKLAKAHQYLFSVRQDFMKSKGGELQAAGVDIGLEQEPDQMQLAGIEHENTIDEMTGSGGIAAAQGGYETLAPKPTKKRKKKSKTTKEEKDPTKFAQKPLENALGMSDRGQGSGSNRLDGFDTRRTRRLHEDLQGGVKFSEPDKLATIGADEVVDESCPNPKRKKKKPAMPHKGRNIVKSIGSAPTGRYGGQGVHEDIQVGDRIEIKAVIEDQFKYINGLRGKIIAFDSGDDPIRIKLDESVYGDDDGCISVREQEIVVIHEDETVELARWIANGRGVVSEDIIKVLGQEILEWTKENSVKELMPHKDDLLPVFVIILEDIANG